ncbi:hypothetical protein ACFLX5_00195 [Chloroflexota bacterium]
MTRVECPDCVGEGIIKTACVKTYVCWRCNGHGTIEVIGNADVRSPEGTA